MKTIALPKVIRVMCLICHYTDHANWSNYGSEQDCQNCSAPAVNLVKAGN